MARDSQATPDPLPDGAELGVVDARNNFSRIVHAASIGGATVYLTSHGKRVAAVVPLDVAQRGRRREVQR